jgi:TolB-like protein/DNA-binding winged helix-turn-helix (wHTH) protein
MAKQNKAFQFGLFRLEVRERRLTREGYPVPLRGRVFDTLCTLIARHGCLVTKDELMAAVWPDSVVEETNLNHNICVLRRALGENATGQKYVETVPRQGYRFVAEVQELDNPDEQPSLHDWKLGEFMPPACESLQGATHSALVSESPQQPTDGRQHLAPAASRPWYSPQRMISLLAVSILLVAAYLGVGQIGFRGGSSDSRLMLAVLPFENLTGDSSQKYIADGFSHEIISQLGRWNIARIGVIAHTSARVYQGTHKSIAEIGRELGVDYIVEGSVRHNRDHYRITVMLIRVDNQAPLWTASYNRALDDATDLQIEVARMVVNQIGRRMGVEPDGNNLIDFPQIMDARSHGLRRRTAFVRPEDNQSLVARPVAADG